jgi:hypothetical protein
LSRTDENDLSPHLEAIEVLHPIRPFVVELIRARPKQAWPPRPASGRRTERSSASFGALALPFRHAASAQWKRALKLTSDADASRARAIETWPAHADLFARKGDHNRTEACLIGVYGLRNGGFA